MNTNKPTGPKDKMTSSKPYMVRAIYEWIADNGLTTYVMVDANQPDTWVPQEFVENGRIVLNISMSVVTDLDINNSGVSFIARFGGVPKDCRFPISAILAIYAKENGRGMAFEQDVDDLDEQEDFENNTNDSSSDDDWYNSINNKQKLSEEEDDDNPPPSGGSSTSGGKRRTGGKGHLKVVK